MGDTTIGASLVLAVAALKNAGDPRSAVLAAYASSDLASNDAILEFFGYVAGLAEDAPKSACPALADLREAIFAKVRAPAPAGYRRRDPDRPDARRAEREGAREDPSPAREQPAAISCDLGEGPGLGRHVLPVFPPGPRSISDFMGFPRACTRQAHEHVVAYAEIVAKERGLTGKDLEDLRAWAKDFFVFDCYRRDPENMSVAVLGAIVEIAFNHTSWHPHGETWTRELFRARGLLAEARSRETFASMRNEEEEHGTGQGRSRRRHGEDDRGRGR